MIVSIKSKQDLVRALSSNEIRFLSETEVVNENGMKALVEKAKSLLRQQKKLHIVIVERG